MFFKVVFHGEYSWRCEPWGRFIENFINGGLSENLEEAVVAGISCDEREKPPSTWVEQAAKAFESFDPLPQCGFTLRWSVSEVNRSRYDLRVTVVAFRTCGVGYSSQPLIQADSRRESGGE